jgi:hypothetical protein
MCKFSHAFRPDLSQKEVYNHAIALTVEGVVYGYSGTVFVYGLASQLKYFICYIFFYVCLLHDFIS